MSHTLETVSRFKCSASTIELALARLGSVCVRGAISGIISSRRVDVHLDLTRQEKVTDFYYWWIAGGACILPDDSGMSVLRNEMAGI